MVIGGAAIVVTAIFFVVPFIFICSSRPRTRSRRTCWSSPGRPTSCCSQNIAEALAARDYLMVIAFINSVILTVASVAALVMLSAMVAYVWQRRRGRWSPLINILVLAGLIVPPAIVPTIWVLQGSACSRPCPA